jgi:hypothetical protein
MCSNTVAQAYLDGCGDVGPCTVRIFLLSIESHSVEAPLVALTWAHWAALGVWVGVGVIHCTEPLGCRQVR